ncbi:hypothetical protein D3C71_1663890 [compost metagenome]
MADESLIQPQIENLRMRALLGLEYLELRLVLFQSAPQHSLTIVKIANHPCASDTGFDTGR